MAAADADYLRLAGFRERVVGLHLDLAEPGGGLFLPLGDCTAGDETYGAGRYLTDTIKGTFGGDLELPEPGADHLMLDFNYAYNPSCAHDSRWGCPLAPPENRLDEPIRVGERTYPHE